MPMMRFIPPALLGLLALCTAASAQLRPPPASAPAPAPAATTPAAPQDVQAKEEAGRAAAQGWLAVLDRRDWGTAWDGSAAMFRSTVPLANWMEGIPKARGDVGALVDREAAVTSYKDQLEGRPRGDYVTVVFASRFERGQLEEVVTTVREPDGRWRVTGYSASAR